MSIAEERGAIVIRESAYLPVVYVTWGPTVIAFAFMKEVRSRATGRRRHRPDEVVGNRKWASLSFDGRAEIVDRIDSMQLGDVGF